MKDRLNEFLAVIDSSRKTELSILMAVLTPALILLIGSWVIDSIEFPEPFQAFDAIRRPFAYFVLLFGVVAFCQLGYAAYNNYRAAWDRLFGQ